MTWRNDYRWQNASHDMRENCFEKNEAIINGRPSKTVIRYKDDDGEWKYRWFEGRAGFIEGHKWGTIIEVERLPSGKALVKYAYNDVHETMWVKVY